jgi:hypothetical protein
MCVLCELEQYFLNRNRRTYGRPAILLIKSVCPHRGTVENEAASLAYKPSNHDASAQLQRLDLGALVTELSHCK